MSFKEEPQEKRVILTVRFFLLKRVEIHFNYVKKFFTKMDILGYV